MTGPIALATMRTSAVLGLRLLVQACSLLLVARLLGPQQFGVFSGVTALAMLLGTLSTFGTHLVLLSQMSRDSVRRAQVLVYALPTTLLCGTVLLAVFLLICELTLERSGIGWRVLLAVGVAELILQPLTALIVVDLLAAERTARSQLLQTLPLALRLVAAGLVAGLQTFDALIVYGYGYFIATAMALVIAVTCMPQAWPHLRQWRWPTIKELQESASFAVLNITAMGPTELDKTLAVRLLPSANAGLYAAGARVVGAVTLPVIALMLSAMPRIFREGMDKSQSTARLLRWIFGASALYSVALAIALWCFAPMFVWLLGSQYEGVDDVIRWLCIAMPGMALRIASGSVLMALGRSWVRAGFEFIGVVVLIVVAILVTENWGVYGLALALACSEWVMALLGGVLVTRCANRNSSQILRNQQIDR